MSTNFVLPKNREAELATLHSILIDPTTLLSVMNIVSPRDFSDEQLRAIYGTILELSANDYPIQPMLITAKLRGTPLFPQSNHHGNSIAVVLGEIAASVATSAHAEHYARVVARASKQRQAILCTSDALSRLQKHEKAEDVLADLGREGEKLQLDLLRGQVTSVDLLNELSCDILERRRQQRIHCGPTDSEFSKFTFGPRMVSVIAAPPAVGKTALAGQVVFDALRREEQQHLKALIANVEMPPEVLLTRQVAGLSGICFDELHYRTYEEDDKSRIEFALDELKGVMPRVEFMRPPFTLENLCRRVKAVQADIVVLDYIQRFTSETNQADLRAQTNAAMDLCRKLADEGRAVLIVSAVSRSSKSETGNYSPKKVGLASLRETSELEFGADMVWSLVPEPGSNRHTLVCLKNRTGEKPSLRLSFDGSVQRFDELPDSGRAAA